MEIRDFLGHLEARKPGSRLEHICRHGVFPPADQWDYWLSLPLYVSVPTEEEWEAKSMELHAQYAAEQTEHAAKEIPKI